MPSPRLISGLGPSQGGLSLKKINLDNNISLNNNLSGNIAVKTQALNTMLELPPLEAAKASKSLTMGTSPFVTGAKFSITGYAYQQIDENDPKSRFYPVFETSLGHLSVTSLLKAKPVKPFVDSQTGETIVAKLPTGTFTDMLRKLLAEHRGKTADEVLPLLVQACKKKKFVVRNREYVVQETAYGDRATPLLHVDIVVE